MADDGRGWHGDSEDTHALVPKAQVIKMQLKTFLERIEVKVER
jgi:hypothetical protein